jgi:tRNA A37 methylthiotransferase MiaB
MISGGTAAYHTLGCKLNFSETSTVARQLSENGFARVNIDENPDVVVINTCSVTDNADSKCRNIVRRSLKSNPQAYIVVIGCYAQLKPQEIANIDGVDLVLGANEKFNLPLMIYQKGYMEMMNQVVKSMREKSKKSEISFRDFPVETEHEPF